MASSGIDNQTIASFVQQNINNPAAIASAAAQYGVTVADLANATGYSVADVNKYFKDAGLSVNQGVSFPERPTPQPSAPQVQTGYTLPNNLNSQGLNSIDPSNLNFGYTGYDQSFGVFTDPSGRSYTPTFGGAENQPISYSTKAKIGNDTVDITYDANGNLMSATGQPFTQNGKQYVTDYTPNGASYREYAGPGNLVSGFAPLIGAAAAAFGIPGIIGGALAPTASAATQAAIGGAVVGGGMAGLTGQNIAKGALLGGALGYGGSQLGQYLNSGVTDPNLLQQAADADMAAGMLPQYGTNAAYDSAMQGLMTNSPGAVQQLQNFVDNQNAVAADVAGGMLPQYGTNQAYDSAVQNMMANSPGAVNQLQNIASSQVGTKLGPDNIDVGGGFNPATGTANVSTALTNPYVSNIADTQVGGVYGPDNIDVGGGFNPATAGGGVPTVVNNPITGGSGGGVAGSVAGGNLLSKLTDNPLTTAAVVNSAAGLINNQNTKNAINSALNTQLAAGQQAGSTLKDIYGQQLGFVAPYQQAGLAGLNLLGQNKDYLTHQFDATDLAKGLAPNYDFMLQQGQMANQRAANVGGGAIGGNALQGLQKFTQDYAGNAYQNAFNNYQQQRQNIFNTLSNIANMGQTANQQAIGAGLGYGQQQTNLATGLAAAQAGATMGQAQNQANLIGNLANNVTLASLLGQKQSVA